MYPGKSIVTKLLIFSLVGLIILMVLAAYAAVVMINIKKPWLETEISQALGIDIKINSWIAIDYFPHIKK